MLLLSSVQPNQMRNLRLSDEFLCAMIMFKIILNLYIVFIVVSSVAESHSLELCLDCLANVTSTRCNVPLCQSNTSCDNKIDLNKYKEGNLEPTLVCRDESSLTFAWNQQNEMYYFIEYTREVSNESKLSELTHCNFMTIKGLNANERYFIDLIGLVSDERHIYRNKTFIANTSKTMLKRTPVEKLNYTLSLIENSYVATVEWEPGSDLSCNYEIVWYGKHEPGEYIHRRITLKKQPKPEFNLMDLEFGKKYHFSIISIDKNHESSKKWLHIQVPSCLKTFQNLSVCPPSKPTSFMAIEYPAIQNGSVTSAVNQTNLKLSWNTPDLEPDYYTVSFQSLSETSNDSFTLRANITGDKNVAVLSNVVLRSYYIIKLVAYSKGGASKPSYIREYRQNNVSNTSIISNENSSEVIPDSTFLSNLTTRFTQWIWIGIIMAMFVITMFIFRHKFKKCICTHWFISEKKIDGTIVRYTISESEDSKWELAESKLLIDKVIGFGAFGIVQKGYYYLEDNKKTEVAVKTLKANPTGDQVGQFYDEIEIMKSVPRHAHIVYLIGVVTKYRPSNPLMLVEYCARGDLQSFLRKVPFVLADSCHDVEHVDSLEDPEDGTKFFNKSYDISTSIIMENKYVLESKDLLSFARQIVVGMEFLSNLKVIHRDLAARNILISENNTLKISDFGLSRDIYTDSIYKKVTGGKLPFRWMALESLTHQVYTTESDVWSFGIVLWEIVTLGGNPYPTVNTEDLVPLLKNGYRMDKPTNCSEELYQMMLNCWQTSPNLRASFKDLRDVFDKLLESKMQYISLEDAKNPALNKYENISIEPEDNVPERCIVPSSNIV